MADDEFDPTDPESYDKRGHGYLAKRDYDNAMADFNQEIQLDPTRGGGYFSRGLTYESKGEYDKAIADFNECIRISPNNHVHYDSRGNVYTKKGEYDQAIADYTESIRLDQDFNPDEQDHVPYEGRGVAYASKGDFDKAIADWEAAAKIEPKDPTAKWLIALVQKQRAKGGALTFPGPNLLAMAACSAAKKQLNINLILMGVGALIGVLLGSSNLFLAIFLAGFFGTFQSNLVKAVGIFRIEGKPGEKFGSFFVSLLLSLIIAPVWFVIKLIKRLKALSMAKAIEKKLSKEIDPNGIELIGELSAYLDSI